MAEGKKTRILKMAALVEVGFRVTTHLFKDLVFKIDTNLALTELSEPGTRESSGRSPREGGTIELSRKAAR